jgi:ABC-type amino acid transport substrate-binding protein
VRGIGSGFWFAAVTMTTVGYGDKAPITFAGRMVSVIWMFAALILTAFLTAQLTTILTAQQVENVVQNVSDLPGARVGNLMHSASGAYFNDNSIDVVGFPSIEAGLQAVADNKLDAFVHDQPLLQWMLGQSNDQLQLLPHLFDPQGYAIATAQDSTLREDINIALLKILTSDDWTSLKAQYLGR